MTNGLVAKLFGADKWPTATATVTATEQVSQGGRSGRTMRVFFTFNTGMCNQDGKFFVDDNSSLYGLSQGEQFSVQFDPRHPSRYYSQEASSLSQTIRITITFVMAAFVITVFLIEHFGR